MSRSFIAVMAGIVFLGSVAAAQDRNVKVRNDRGEIESAGSWIYNDLPQAFQQARRDNRPLLVVLRCIP